MLAFLPLGLPILDADRLIAWQERLGFTLPTTEKAHARAALPHHFAWQFGWDEMVAAVAAAYHAMPAEEQARVAVIGNNYGDSGAIDLLGPKYGLPMKALGTHQSYWLWGPGDPSKDVFIVLGDRPERLARWCGDVAGRRGALAPVDRRLGERPRPRVPSPTDTARGDLAEGQELGLRRARPGPDTMGGCLGCRRPASSRSSRLPAPARRPGPAARRFR